MLVGHKMGITPSKSSFWCTVKPVLNGHSKIITTKILLTDGSLMKIESNAECSPWSILQTFQLALSDNWSWKSIFSLLRAAVLHRFYWNKLNVGITPSTLLTYYHPLKNSVDCFGRNKPWPMVKYFLIWSYTNWLSKYSTIRQNNSWSLIKCSVSLTLSLMNIHARFHQLWIIICIISHVGT